MNRNLLLMNMVGLIALALFTGCEKESPAPAPAAPQKVAAPSPGKPPAQPAPEVAAEAVPPKYVYDPTGRRDPFEPLTAVKSQVARPDTPLTPLQKFDLGQLRLIGVIIGRGEPTAMVTAPDGKSYILKKGIKVGRNDGIVIKIAPDAVLVEERYYDFSGEVRKGVQTIQLPKREGV